MDGTSFERFHTFWQRFLAALIDGAVLGPVGWPTAILIGYGPLPVAVGWLIVTCPVGFAYTSYCHGRWGKTLGKHAVGILVVRQTDESPLGYRRAIARDAGAIFFAIAGTTILVSFLVSGGDRDSFRIFDQASLEYTEEELQEKTSGEIFREAFSEAFPAWQLMVIPALSSIWFLAELVTMLSNPRRRALHDLIGGSVVIKVSRPPKAPPPPPPPPADPPSSPRPPSRPTAALPR